MRIDAVGDHGAIGCGDGRACWTRCSSSWTIRGAWVSIGRTDTIGGLGGLSRLGRVGMTAQAGTFEEMLLLSRGILCANLLTVDTLNGKTLDGETPKNGFRMLAWCLWWV